MSLILHLETSTKTCSVALSEDGQVICVREETTEGYSHAEKLTLFIEDVLSQSSFSLKDLNAVSVTSGPGSYTGLRIGVSTGKGLCYALGIPLLAVDSLVSLAEVGRRLHPNVNLCPMLDARRMEVYSAIYNAHGEIKKPISADVLDENSYEEFMPFVCFGDGATKMVEYWKNRDIVFDDNISTSASGHARIAFSKFKNQQFEDLAYFEPFYLKDFVAGKKATKKRV